MGFEINDMWRNLVNLHRAVNMKTSSFVRVCRFFQDGKPDIIVTVYEYGLKFSDRCHIYPVSGEGAEQAYKEAMEHMTELLELKTA